MKKTLFLLLWVLTSVTASSSTIGSLMVLTVEGVINPVVSDYINSAIRRAEEKQATAILIELNTPGGLLDSTRSAISAMINTDIPIIVYVTPRGSRATSAGVFLTMASDLAAMAPETHIGAAHPVTIGGDPSQPAPQEKFNEKKGGKEEAAKNFPAVRTSNTSVMEEKMVSDAAAYIRTLAKDHGRNAVWAERAVRKSVSLTSEEALQQNVIELIADSREDLLKKLEGREIKKNNKTIKLNFKNTLVDIFPMSQIQKFLQILGHPNVAYILMMLGIYGLIYEFSTPGIGLGGAVGGICLFLAFYSLQVLPINTVGLVLIIFGIACLVVEVMAPTHGLLTMGGLISFGIGSFMLIDVPHDLSIPRVSLTLILPTVLSTGAFFSFVIRKAFAARRMRPQTGQETLMGAIGEVRREFSPEGMVFLNGELWLAISEEAVRIGDQVVVTGIRGNTLRVKKYNSR